MVDYRPMVDNIDPLAALNVNIKLEFCKAEFAIMSKTEPLII